MKTRCRAKRVLIMRMLAYVLLIVVCSESSAIGDSTGNMFSWGIAGNDAFTHMARCQKDHNDEAKRSDWNSAYRISIRSFPIEVTSEIEELACALGKNPVRIYEYVKNQIDYIPYFGYLQGAAYTCLAKSGNDFDQAALLIALLRVSGYSANFILGKMTIPTFGAADRRDMAHWLSVEPNIKTVRDLLSNSFLPATCQEKTTMLRVWVRAKIGRRFIDLDPAFKIYEEKCGIDIGNAIGYDPEELMIATEGVSGNDNGAIWVRHLNDIGLNAYLDKLTTNFINEICSKHSLEDITDVLGGRSVIKRKIETLPAAIQFPIEERASFSHVPFKYVNTIRIQFGQIDWSCSTAEIAGRKLSITFDEHAAPADAGINTTCAQSMIFGNSCLSDATKRYRKVENVDINRKDYIDVDTIPRAKLLLDDNLVCMEKFPVEEENANKLTITVDHRWGKRTGAYNIERQPRAAYAIATAFGRSRDEQLIRNRIEKMNQYVTKGMEDTAPEIVTEMLFVIGLKYFLQTSLHCCMLGEIYNVTPFWHHRLAVVGQKEFYYLDTKQQLGNMVSRYGRDKDKISYVKSWVPLMSTLEHGVLEQHQSGTTGTSAFKLLAIANGAGQKIYQIKDENNLKYLYNYDKSTLSSMAYRLHKGATLIAPAKGQLTGPGWDWNGYGYFSYQELGNKLMFSLRMGGDVDGGVAVKKGYLSRTNFSQRTIHLTMQPRKISGEKDVAGTIVWNPSEAQYNHVDLRPKFEKFPGFEWTRAYHGRNRLKNDILGNGWSHNYSMKLLIHSYPEAMLGARSVRDAAARIVEAFVTSDLMRKKAGLREWIVAALVALRSAENLSRDSISLYHLGKMLSFVELRDGNYSGPAGISANLSKVGSHYWIKNYLRFKLGFDESGRLEMLLGQSGDKLLFEYDACDADRLKLVRDDFGNFITFDYLGDKLIALSDNAGKRVNYDYDAKGNLVTFTESSGERFCYSYDSESGIITKVENSNNIF